MVYNAWLRVHELLKIFANNQPLLFGSINLQMIEKVRQYLLVAPKGAGKKGTISKNTASSYFGIFKTTLKQAFVDGYFTVDIAAKIKGIQGQESRREHLPLEELNQLLLLRAATQLSKEQPYSLPLPVSVIATS